MKPDTTTFRSILVPLDGSPLAEQALPLAVAIAQRAGAKLRLTLVHELPTPPLDPASAQAFPAVELGARKAEGEYLRSWRERLRRQGITSASAATLSGPVGTTLVDYVGEVGADLVVMTTHGRGGLQRAWLGSVADHLIRHLEIPVLLARPESAAAAEAPIAMHRILVPMDESALAEQALTPAAAMARLWDAELSLLEVVRPVLLSTDPALPLPSGYDEDVTTLYRQQAQAYLDGRAERLRAQGIRATGSACIGWYPVDTLLEMARAEQIGMVVIATHGRGGLRRLALGSVADQLVRSAKVPVMVCRPAAHPEPETRPKGRATAGPAVAGRTT